MNWQVDQMLWRPNVVKTFDFHYLIQLIEVNLDFQYHYYKFKCQSVAFEFFLSSWFQGHVISNCLLSLYHSINEIAPKLNDWILTSALRTSAQSFMLFTRSPTGIEEFVRTLQYIVIITSQLLWDFVNVTIFKKKSGKRLYKPVRIARLCPRIYCVDCTDFRLLWSTEKPIVICVQQIEHFDISVEL